MTRRITQFRLDLSGLLDAPPKAPDHVLHGLPVGGVGCLVGPGGSGKTMLGAMLAVGSAIGRGPAASFGLSGKALEREPAKVVFVTAEESAEEMLSRLYRVAKAILNAPAGGSCGLDEDELVGMLNENVDIYPLAGRPPIRLDDHNELSDAIPPLKEAANGARLLILDPLRQFHRADENESGGMTEVVRRLQELAHGAGCGVLLMHHTNKQSTQLGQGDQAGASRGSAALTDAVRLQLNLSRIDPTFAKSNGIAIDDAARHVRLDVAKANYISTPDPIIMRRDEAGVPIPVRAPKKSRGGGL